MEKIKEIIDKLLGKGNDSSSDSAGFTLIELLIVIAVIGILAAALLVAIDPIDKINAGNDTKVISNIRNIYDGSLRYYANNGQLPTTGPSGTMVTSGELKTWPTPPNQYTPTVYTMYPSSTNDDVSICMQVKSKANKAKQNAAGTVPAGNVNVFISGGSLCYTTSACASGYMPTTTGSSLCY